jgi:hypothetical protein
MWEHFAFVELGNIDSVLNAIPIKNGLQARHS